MPQNRVKPIPEGMHSLTPHIVCAGAAEAIEFYKKAFNAREEGRMPGPDGKLMHAMVRIGDSTLMLVDEMPQWGALGPKSLKGSPVTIHLYVEDVDATVAQAVKAGAKVTMPVDEHSGATATASSKTRSATSGRWPRTRATSRTSRSPRA